MDVKVREEARKAAIETLAQRLHFKSEHFDPSGEPPWEELSEHQKEFWRLCVSSLLEERQPVLTVMASAGYVMVPKEPTEAMVDAITDDWKARLNEAQVEALYRAMIDAATNPAP